MSLTSLINRTQRDTVLQYNYTTWYSCWRICQRVTDTPNHQVEAYRPTRWLQVQYNTIQCAICKAPVQWRLSVSNIVRVQNPSPSSSSPPFLLHLELGPLIQLGCVGSVGKALAVNEFGAFWEWRNAAGGIQDARFHTTQNGFSLHFYEEIFQELSFCSRIIVRVQAIENPHNHFIVRVRTCGPSRDRRPPAHAPVRPGAPYNSRMNE